MDYLFLTRVKVAPKAGSTSVDVAMFGKESPSNLYSGWNGCGRKITVGEVKGTVSHALANSRSLGEAQTEGRSFPAVDMPRYTLPLSHDVCVAVHIIMRSTPISQRVVASDSQIVSPAGSLSRPYSSSAPIQHVSTALDASLSNLHRHRHGCLSPFPVGGELPCTPPRNRYRPSSYLVASLEMLYYTLLSTVVPHSANTQGTPRKISSTGWEIESMESIPQRTN